MTNRRSVPPEPMVFGEVSTVAAFDSWDQYTAHVIAFEEWVSVFSIVAGRYFTPNVMVVPNETLHPIVGEPPVWLRIKTSGEYALEISKVFNANTCGARLVNCADGSVLQYQPEVSSNVTISFSDPSAATLSWSVMTNEPFNDGAFLMDVEEGALAAMDDYEREVEERYRAAGARDAHALQFDRG